MGTFERQVGPGLGVLGNFERQVDSGPAVLGTFERQVGSGTAVLGTFECQVGPGPVVLGIFEHQVGSGPPESGRARASWQSCGKRQVRARGSPGPFGFGTLGRFREPLDGFVALEAFQVAASRRTFSSLAALDRKHLNTYQGILKYIKVH